MLRKLLIIIIVLISALGLNAQSGAIKGLVIDNSTNEPIPFANVVVEQNGTQIGGCQSDFDGKYTIKPVPAGKFTVKASCVGYATLQVDGVLVKTDQIQFLDLKLEVTSQQIEVVTVISYKTPLIDKDNTQTGGSVTSEDISRMSGRSAESVAATVGGVYQENGQVQSVRGARTEGTVYYIDGVKVRGTNSLPKSSIEQVSVVTGGLDAKYGDATGGIISITTRGPSRVTEGGIELMTSKFLDAYNDNLIGLNLTGPLFFKSELDPADNSKIIKTPIAGYFLSGEFSYKGDPNPRYGGVYKLKDEMYDSIVRSPIVPSSSNVIIPTADMLRKSDFEKIKSRKNSESMGINIACKLDFSMGKNGNLTLGSTFDYSNGHQYTLNTDKVQTTFAGGDYNGPGYANHALNWRNYPTDINDTWRVYAKYTQKFGGASANNEESSIIKNAYMSIQFDFSKYHRTIENEKHKDNFFNYGYIGKFTTHKIPSFQYEEYVDSFTDPNNIKYYKGWIQDAFADTLVEFERSDINFELANFTDRYYNLYEGYNDAFRNTSIITNNGGLINGSRQGSIYNLLPVPGEQYNTYRLDDNEQFRVVGHFSADIKDHEFSAGMEFEQRTDRLYNVNPIELWDHARRLINSHILELSKSDPVIGYIRDQNGNIIGDSIFNDTVTFLRNRNLGGQSYFDRNFRVANGLDPAGREWIDIDSYSPDKLSIDYFSADELLNTSGSRSYVLYYGYDHHGKKLKNNPSFDDFFTDFFKDENGIQRYKREVAAYRPSYLAFYVQDKFSFSDLVFKIGVRVDRFDANQKVLKDPYIMFENYRVGDIDKKGFFNPNPNNPNYNNFITVPSNIKAGSAVYVDNLIDPSSIVGYRMENKWYDAEGNEILDPTDLYTATGIAPYLVEPNAKINVVFDPSDPHQNQANDPKYFLNAWTDYSPRWEVAPRVSFSFPISDVALFYAHYDIYTKRPDDGTVRLDPIEILRYKTGDLMSNSNLKPEKTIDYELGFQQKVSNTSSLKLSAFYREMRDMVQVISRVGAFPYTYNSYGNIDFGTVKGFTLSFDMRRTGNIRLMATYTLQFANGTGSNTTTALGLINSGQPNLRATLPLDFDQRHAITANIDYRFASGKDYNGPRLFGNDILQNFGANLTLNAGSGTPFTRREEGSNYVIGSINGSLKPWTTTINIKFDKDFELSFGGEGNKKDFTLNLYLDISNLLNKKNILDVYSVSGNPDDDGYLTANRNQPFIDSQNDPVSYRQLYQMIIDNPSRYGLPRQIRLGAILSF